MIVDDHQTLHILCPPTFLQFVNQYSLTEPCLAMKNSAVYTVVYFGDAAGYSKPCNFFFQISAALCSVFLTATKPLFLVVPIRLRTALQQQQHCGVAANRFWHRIRSCEEEEEVCGAGSLLQRSAAAQPPCSGSEAN